MNEGDKAVDEMNSEIQQKNLDRIDEGKPYCEFCGADLSKHGFITRESSKAGQGCGVCEGI